jgi:hypothetical protein
VHDGWETRGQCANDGPRGSQHHSVRRMEFERCSSRRDSECNACGGPGAARTISSGRRGESCGVEPGGRSKESYSPRTRLVGVCCVFLISFDDLGDRTWTRQGRGSRNPANSACVPSIRPGSAKVKLRQIDRADRETRCRSCFFLIFPARLPGAVCRQVPDRCS